MKKSILLVCFILCNLSLYSADLVLNNFDDITCYTGVSGAFGSTMTTVDGTGKITVPANNSGEFIYFTLPAGFDANLYQFLKISVKSSETNYRFVPGFITPEWTASEDWVGTYRYTGAGAWQDVYISLSGMTAGSAGTYNKVALKIASYDLKPTFDFYIDNVTFIEKYVADYTKDVIVSNFDNVISPTGAWGNNSVSIASNPNGTGNVGLVSVSANNTGGITFNTTNKINTAIHEKLKFKVFSTQTFTISLIKLESKANNNKINTAIHEKLKFKVFSTQTFTISLIKLESKANNTINKTIVQYLPYSKPNQWQDFSLDLTSYGANLYDVITIMPMAWANAPAFTFYMDDIMLTVKPVYNTVTLPNVFSSNMVIQQDMQAALWGWALPNDTVEITAGWGQTATTKAGADGKWSTTIQTPKAIPGQPTPYTLTFKGSTNTVQLSNVLIGDVWVCSGQSNMEYNMTVVSGGTRGVKNYASEIAAANFPNIRLFKVAKMALIKPTDNCDGTWLECNPTNVASFSAVAYYFGRELNQNSQVNIPIGLLEAAYGGSRCESWISRETLAAETEFNTKILAPYDAAPLAVEAQYRPTNLFNAMLAPIIPYGIKGALWYQGEANTLDGAFYTKLCGAMLQDWRTRWGVGNFPFYYVQLPAYTDANWPSFRDAQTNMLTIPNTGMAVTVDIVDSNPADVHPDNKLEVGQRLAKWALAKDYGQNITYSGPVYKSNTVQGNKMIISYHPATIGTGLISKYGAALREFQIAGSNGVFYAATANIVDNTVEVSSPNVAVPTVVKYAYTAALQPNLINSDGLPAAPFKTDTWNNSIIISSVLSAVDVVNSQHHTIYPNPVKDILFIESSEVMKSVYIHNVSGKIILKKNVENKSKVELNTSSFQPGIYLIRVHEKSGREVNSKIVITK
ncbi:MAG: T9SS type A sorting domain-containing protein [Bacteroidia bacterium]|nr:T9SS type A sorting domain-containing protein [Bacteroidia bacterium]